MTRIRKTTHTLAGLALALSHSSGVMSAEAGKAAPAATAAAAAAMTSGATSTGGWPKLQFARDSYLQAGLQSKLKDLGLSRYAADRKLALALVDITEPKHPRVATVNAYEMMYAASLPKIAILLGAFQKADEGKLTIDPPTEQLLTDMIRRSSNSAATIMLERVGYDYVADMLQSERYDLYDEDLNGGLWVGKPYAKDGAVKRDPLYNLSHGATPFEVARFYYLLATDRLVSPEACDRMREILSEPAINHKFVAGLNSARPGSKIFRKSGTWRTYHADSAIVERNGRRYIAVAMANHPSGGKWLSQIIVAMDDLIFSPDNVARDNMAFKTDVIEPPKKKPASHRT